jgi:hypothetical protein
MALLRENTARVSAFCGITTGGCAPPGPAFGVDVDRGGNSHAGDVAVQGVDVVSTHEACADHANPEHACGE